MHWLLLNVKCIQEAAAAVLYKQVKYCFKSTSYQHRQFFVEIAFTRKYGKRPISSDFYIILVWGKGLHLVILIIFG